MEIELEQTSGDNSSWIGGTFEGQPIPDPGAKLSLVAVSSGFENTDHWVGVTAVITSRSNGDTFTVSKRAHTKAETVQVDVALLPGNEYTIRVFQQNRMASAKQTFAKATLLGS